MYKKFLRLALTGALLFQTGNICTFAYNKDEFDATGNSAKVDYCKNFPKNQYGQTVDIDCAFTQLMHDQKASNGRKSGKAIRIGPNGDHEVRMWHVEQLKGFGKEIEHLAVSRNKDALKYDFIGNLIDATNNFFSLNSSDLAVSITEELVANSNFFKNAKVTAREINDWKKEYKGLPKYKSNITYWGTYGIWGLCPIYLYDFRQRKRQEEETFYERLRQAQAQKSLEEGIKAKVYSSLMDQVIYAVLNKGYVGKDSLVADLDFSKDNYGAQTYFTDVGLNQKICGQDVKAINDYVENSSKGRIGTNNESADKKEEL